MSSRLIRKEQLLEHLSARTGVCQEHLLSPFAVLFILENVYARKMEWHLWTLWAQLDDLDLGDDLARCRR